MWAGGFPTFLQTQVKQIKIGQNTYTVHIYLYLKLVFSKQTLSLHLLLSFYKNC